MHVIYSWDCNVLRAIFPKGKVECLPLVLGDETKPGGRSLRPDVLKLIAKNHWHRRITRFTYLNAGEGYEP